jgi:hypothetical protein
MIAYKYVYWVGKMKECRLNLRISARRMNKFRDYAVDKDKTLTQLVEDWIDSLPVVKESTIK